MTRSSAFLGILKVLRTKIKVLNANNFCLKYLKPLRNNVESAFYSELEKAAEKRGFVEMKK